MGWDNLILVILFFRIQYHHYYATFRICSLYCLTIDYSLLDSMSSYVYEKGTLDACEWYCGLNKYLEWTPARTFWTSQGFHNCGLT